MGIGAWWHWLVVLLIVVLVFGTKKLRNLGGDVGGAVKDFKDAMNTGKNAGDELSVTPARTINSASPELIEVKAAEVEVEIPAPKKRAAAKKPATTKASAPKASAAKPKATAAKKPVAKPKAPGAKKSSAE